MSDVFMSYAREDLATAERVAELIEADGHSVFLDRRIAPGDAWDEVLARELKAARCVIVLWSKTSVVSRWVKAEASEATERSLLLPVLIDHAEIPFQFKSIQTVDLTDWNKSADHAAFESLLGGVRRAQSSGPDKSPRLPMKRRVHRKFWRLLLLTTLLLTVAAATIWKIGEQRHWFALKFPYHTLLKSADGLAAGDEVILKGRAVGRITQIELMPPGDLFEVSVAFVIRQPYEGFIWSDSRAQVTWNPSKQKRRISITPGTSGVASYKSAPDNARRLSFWDEQTQKYVPVDEKTYRRWGFLVPADESLDP